MSHEPTVEPIKPIKTGTCTSLSGKTKLHYEFGLDASGAWHARIPKSSGTGYYSNDWVAMEHVQRVLAKNGNRPITCHTLEPIFKGKSVNTAGFMLAVLKHVGLVQQSPDNPRTHALLDGKAFFAELQAAAAGGKGAKAVKAVKPADLAAPVTKPLSAKKKAASRTEAP
jgi:hypothetical protein